MSIVSQLIAAFKREAEKTPPVPNPYPGGPTGGGDTYPSTADDGHEFRQPPPSVGGKPVEEIAEGGGGVTPIADIKVGSGTKVPIDRPTVGGTKSPDGPSEPGDPTPGGGEGTTTPPSAPFDPNKVIFKEVPAGGTGTGDGPRPEVRPAVRDILTSSERAAVDADATLNSGGVNPLVVSRDRALGDPKEVTEDPGAGDDELERKRASLVQINELNVPRSMNPPRATEDPDTGDDFKVEGVETVDASAGLREPGKLEFPNLRATEGESLAEIGALPVSPDGDEGGVANKDAIKDAIKKALDQSSESFKGGQKLAPIDDGDEVRRPPAGFTVQDIAATEGPDAGGGSAPETFGRSGSDVPIIKPFDQPPPAPPQDTGRPTTGFKIEDLPVAESPDAGTEDGPTPVVRPAVRDILTSSDSFATKLREGAGGVGVGSLSSSDPADGGAVFKEFKTGGFKVSKVEGQLDGDFKVEWEYKDINEDGDIKLEGAKFDDTYKVEGIASPTASRDPDAGDEVGSSAAKAQLDKQNESIDRGMEEAGQKADISREIQPGTRGPYIGETEKDLKSFSSDPEEGGEVGPGDSLRSRAAGDDLFKVKMEEVLVSSARPGVLADDDDLEPSTLVDLRPQLAAKEMLPGLGGEVPDHPGLDLDSDANADTDADESEL